MSHTVTCKLNKAARQHQGQAGTTFFVSLGEHVYNYKTKEKVWSNYEAALFAKDSQIAFYAQSLVEGSIVSVSGSAIILEMPDNPEYSPRMVIQDAKLEFVYSGQQPQQQSYQQPQQQAAPQQQYQQPPQHQQNGGPVAQQQPHGTQPPSQAQAYAPQQGVYDPNQPPPF